MTMHSLPQVNMSTVDVVGMRSELARSIAGEVRFGRLDRAIYSTDASVYQIVPLGVVIPKTPDDVIATLKMCAHFDVPITARGGGTSQAGQSIGPGVILDFSKYLHRVLEINPAERWVRVEPGCVLDDLNCAVKPMGLQFAPDISTANRATIGGMVANNSSGTHSIIHGKTIDHVLELKVLLADGSIIDTRPLNEAGWEAKCIQQDLEGACYRTVRRLAAKHASEIERRYPKILRRVGGYNLDAFARSPGVRYSEPRGYPRGSEYLTPGLGDCNLAHLFVGSEGTLGIVLEAKLRLIELPRAKALCVVRFEHLLDALAATPAILEHAPAAVEVMDRFILDCTRLNAEAARLRDFIHGDPGAILIIEFYGDAIDELLTRLDALEGSLRARNVNCHRATDPAAQARVWKLRTLALGLSMAEKGDAKAISFVEDTAVDPSQLRDYIDEFLQIVARHGTKAGVYAHASVGCLHVRPIVDLKTSEGVDRFQRIADDVAELVLKYGGALSGEHGDGLVRSPYQEKMYGSTLYQAFREIKRTFDSQNLLNPGKIVDAPPLASNLRYGPAYVTPEVPTTFDFSAEGGLTRAAELCAGVGECRKKRAGTMCPSYQATCDELHSTRGRANTLRLALTGQLDAMAACGLALGSDPASAKPQADRLTDPTVLAALDLCLECKACKSECPTNVDMARLKAEVLDQHHKKHGLPWRNWLFGNVASVSKWGCRLAPLSNWWSQSGVGRWMNQMLLGIDRRRPPPRFASAPLWSWADGKQAPEQGPSVLMFPDTFTTFHEPDLGRAAVTLLERVAAVFPASVGQAPWLWNCCGRPMISNGMLDSAIALAEQKVDWLYHWGGPIVACEPSCILTIKDDYPALLKGELRAKAKAVAERCFTFEEFLDQSLKREQSGERSSLTLQALKKRILVQPHCHQRSLVGTAALINLLKRIPGAEVIDLDAGCCGMAGSFGYEVEHYEISRLVGEQRLFPAIRAAGPEDVIVAPGFSCRLQIEHFTGRKAVHPATLLRSLLAT